MTVPSGDSDDIQVGEEDLSAIVDYIVFIARLKEGGKEAMEATGLLQNFLSAAAKYNAKLLNNSIYRTVMGLPREMQQRPEHLEQKTPR